MTGTVGHFVLTKIDLQFSGHGPAFKLLAVSHTTNVAGDLLVALALADTLFFSVPTAEARGNMVAFLLLTLAPFALIGPLLGSLAHRKPGSHRAGLVFGSLGRVVLVIAILRAQSDLVMLSLVFGVLVLSRTYGIGRSSLLPALLPGSAEMVEANARLARLGIFAGGAFLPIGWGVLNLLGNQADLVLAALVYAWSGVAALRLMQIKTVPTPVDPKEDIGRAAPSTRSPARPRSIGPARIATAIVRLLNGYLLVLVAFAFREGEQGIAGFGALMAAAGAGYAISSFLARFLARHLREEPMVAAALALEAAAAFISSHAFGVWSAAAVSLFAGLAWGTAKFGYDGLLHAGVKSSSARARTFAYSETLFQLAWVVGAVIPVLLTIPTTLGLILAGCVALLAQVVLISTLLISLTKPA